jgi:MerR family transcriptional regulator, light-induced transcriptional regulator
VRSTLGGSTIENVISALPPPGPAGGRAPGLTVAAVARRLGVAPATLRTWDRRYGLGPSEHTVGAHRRYSPLDVSRLDLMRRMVNSGVAPGDAARAALAAAEDALLAPAAAAAGSAAAVDRPLAAATRPDLLAAPPGAGAAVRGLTRAALALDAPGCLDLITDCLDRRGVIWVWDHLLAPTLRGVGRRWEATGDGVEVEHLLSEAIIAAMTSVALRLRGEANSRPVLLAAAPDELHSLPLFVVAAALAERRVGARVLGARVPHRALVDAIRRIGPGAVLLYSYRDETGDLAGLAHLPALRPAPLLIVGGPGWHGTPPPGVTTVDDLTDAVTRIASVAG